MLSTDRECARDGCSGDARHPVVVDGAAYCCYPCADADDDA